MKALLLASLLVRLTSASTPTSYIDIHQITSFTETGSLETGYLFRIPASESNFGKSPPKGPAWSTHTALTSGATHGDPDNVNSKTRNNSSKHPSHRLLLPPSSDEFLCNEALGKSDYKNPAGNSAGSGIFDPDTLLSGFEGSYILVERGQCTFEAKARSAQRLGASGVIVRNTLDSRYGLLDEDASTSNGSGGPDWKNTEWPVEKRDYECGTNKAAGGVGWRAEIDASLLDFNPAPYDGSHNNLLLTGPAVDGNLCVSKQPIVDSFEKKCPSERCLLTGKNASNDGSTLEACCAWDAFMRMGADGDDDGDAIPPEEEEDIIIPALFVTIENGEELYDLVIDADQNSGGGESVQFLNIVPYARWYPSVHWSSVLLCVLAVFTLWISAYKSANEYRSSWKKISQAVNDGVLVFQRSATNGNDTTRERVETEDTVDLNDENVDLELAPEVEMTNQNTAATATAAATDQDDVPVSPIDPEFSISEDEDLDDFVGNPSSPSPENGTTNDENPLGNEETNEETVDAAATAPTESSPTTPPSSPPPQRVNLQSRSTGAAAQNMEITAIHAFFFVIFASALLFMLFFFDLYKIVRVIYGLAGVVAMNQVMIYPVYSMVCSKYLGKKLSDKLKSNAFGDLPGCRGEYYKWIEIASSVTGLALGIAWIVVGMTHVKPMENVYYWIMQDVIGVCFCILILGIIHVNTIMVATILLLLVFIYDIFYVFISPYIFGSSVMIDVATGGNNVSPSFCEKYPSDRACRGTLAPLPMLLAIPWFNDFRGGFSMIGLGDIILPGLLISFAARYDAARALVRKCSRTSSIRNGENAVDAEGAEGEANEFSGSKRYHYHLGRVQKALFDGYFGPLVIAYTLGLMVAYIAVWTMRMGQPALLYLVPFCLGTTLFLGWRRRELAELWSGPKIMRKANRMVGIAAKIPEVRSAAARAASDSLAETSTMV
ncbi:hypothetical protein ACHAXR_012286 [Thalassiosira sp. AJA248-18]